MSRARAALVVMVAVFVTAMISWSMGAANARAEMRVQGGPYSQQWVGDDGRLYKAYFGVPHPDYRALPDPTKGGAKK